MSDTASCREIRQALGVYVLGAIDPAERAQVEEHLAACADCREELASLAGLPALLHRVPKAEARRLAEADHADDGQDDAEVVQLLPAALARTARVRRDHRLRELAAAAAVAVLALGAGAAGASLLHGTHHAITLPRHPSSQFVWQTAFVASRTTGESMTVKYSHRLWGTEMRVNVGGIPVGTFCQFQVTDTAGHHWLVGGWRVTSANWDTSYPATTFLTEASLRNFELIANGKVLLKAPAT